MDHIFNPTNWNLPQPATNAPQQGEDTSSVSREVGTQPLPLGGPAIAIQTPLPTTTQGPVATASSDGSQSSLAASEGELIEKEWVKKAKEIVERTREDPRLQAQEMTRIKAEYLQKRYGKTLKVDE